jgi:hypothetical protein
MSHIVSDGWSMGLFERELEALYESYSTGLESPLRELLIQYADYASWQREWLTGAILDEKLGYWREQLKGAPTELTLPTDRARPAVQSHSGASHSFRISAEVSAGLQALSRAADVTLFMTLLAGWQTLLYRYSGQSDIVVGSPVAGRNRVEVEGLIGFFVNMLALRGRLDPEMMFRTLLNQAREVCLGAYAHQGLPFEKLVEELQPERTLSHSPIFQVSFALQNAPKEGLRFEGLKLGMAELETGVAKFDILLGLLETGRGLLGGVEYNTDLFDVATIERLMGHYANLLASVVADPQQRLAELRGRRRLRR